MPDIGHSLLLGPMYLSRAFGNGFLVGSGRGGQISLFLVKSNIYQLSKLDIISNQIVINYVMAKGFAYTKRLWIFSSKNHFAEEILKLFFCQY